MEANQATDRPLPQPKKASSFKKFVRWFLVILILVLGAFLYWKYFYTYSEGGRSGLLQKFSRKGNVFKTYEGELVLSSIASTNNVALASEKFYFSVTNDSLAKLIMQQYEGKRVRIHYVEKNGALPWRGDTKYIVNGIERDSIN